MTFAYGMALCLMALIASLRPCAATNSFPVRIIVDASKPVGELKPIWRFFGADEPNYAYMRNGQKLLTELGELAPGKVFFRAHNLLTSGDGTPALKWGSTGAYSEDASGAPIYNWTILDQIFDTYVARGVLPYAQIGFMPQALSTKPEPYRHHWTPQAKYEEIYTGWAYPPNNYQRWGDLVYQWASHCIQRYGADEVEKWYWEVWNEPNIGYWRGTAAEFHRLHDVAIEAVRRALPRARVGGPDVAGSGGRFMRDFLDHCLTGTNYATGQVGTPLDFVSFHAKGAPSTTNDHVVMGIAAHLRTVDEGFRIVSSYAALKGKPVIIGESDPEGCAACQGPTLAYRNGTMYSSYTAASFARIHELAQRHGVNLEGALTWAFEFEDQPYFAGFRSLASNGIDKPVLNVFRMFSRMEHEQIRVWSDGASSLETVLARGIRGQPDVSALASRSGNRITVLAWHYHDEDIDGPEARVTMEVKGLPPTGVQPKLQHFRIDEEHSNAFTAWKRLGSPQTLTPGEYATLEAASKLASPGNAADISNTADGLTLKFSLPRRAVDLFVIDRK